ncbi:MAG: NTP transferase domain-containing protein [Kofleriaceae bacterium]
MSRAAVILAAGAGTRLGGVAKAMLKTRGGQTFLDQIVRTAREAGLDRGVVVVGPPFGVEVAAHAGTLGLSIVENFEPGRGMASSIALGFAALLELDDVTDAWLWPVDHPDVRVETLEALIAARGSHAAARPLVDGRGGHPPLIARALFAELAGCESEPEGARSVLARADMLDVVVADRGAIRDLDTLDDVELPR